MSKPLTNAQVRNSWCFRCQRRKGEFQWSACADNNKWRPLCMMCDHALNRMILRWMRDPNWRAKCERYEAGHESK